jgi:4-amino-4-deoxy-L-arabinose transferase-like glycosyltransferase
MTRSRSITWVVAVAATLVFVDLVPYRLTDGDSCDYAAMAHDMVDGGWRVWFAPMWDFHGAWVPFREHPPGALWLSALCEAAGARPANAALVANVLWTFAAVAGVVALARRFMSSATADLAGLTFLLHAGVIRYVQRAGLELPLAACAVWTLAGAVRLRDAWWWTWVTGIALAGCFLVRGVFGLVPAAVLAVVFIEPTLRPPMSRLVGAASLAVGSLIAFDALHFAAAGEEFWQAYLRRQVFSSLALGGTGHSIAGESWAYYVGRTLVYTLPWSLLPVARLFRRTRPLTSPAAWRLAVVWIALTVVGASLSSRAASRYIFQIYVATSLLAALALGPDLRPGIARAVAVLVVLALPTQIALKSFFLHKHNDAWSTAGILESHRDDPLLAGRTVIGPSDSEGYWPISLVRFHLGLPVSSAPQHAEGGLHWVPGAGADFPVGRVVLATPLGALIDYDAR